MTQGRRLYVPYEEGALRIFIAVKNPSLSAGLEPVNLMSNCKHAKDYTTEDN
jgi:hypothetical protein